MRKLALEIDDIELDVFPRSAFNVSVRRLLFAFIALLVLVAVLCVFVSPAVDLDPTVTRAWQLAFLLICALAYLGRVLLAADVMTEAFRFLQWPCCFADGPPCPVACRLQRNCSLLC